MTVLLFINPRHRKVSGMNIKPKWAYINGDEATALRLAARQIEQEDEA